MLPPLVCLWWWCATVLDLPAAAAVDENAPTLLLLLLLLFPRKLAARTLQLLVRGHARTTVARACLTVRALRCGEDARQRPHHAANLVQPPLLVLAV